MLYGYDLLGWFSSVEKSHQDDAFAESVLGSQGNKEDLERFAAAMRSGDEGKEWLNHHS
jgi:hypothetical protein